jgi:hypothetical protein
MRDVVQVVKLDRAVAGHCVLCGLDGVLTDRVIYYRQFTYSVCRVCGRGLQRHVNWLAVARVRYLKNRLQGHQDGE